LIRLPISRAGITGRSSPIQKLVAGPYLELFARAPRAGWDVWGNQTDKFTEAAE
jgi:N6-adenosine-specific RNA methylase IME4